MQLSKKARIKLAMFNFVLWFAMAFAERLGFATIIFIFAACYLAYEVTTLD